MPPRNRKLPIYKERIGELGLKISRVRSYDPSPNATICEDPLDHCNIGRIVQLDRVPSAWIYGQNRDMKPDVQKAKLLQSLEQFEF